MEFYLTDIQKKNFKIFQIKFLLSLQNVRIQSLPPHELLTVSTIF